MNLVDNAIKYSPDGGIVGSRSRTATAPSASRSRPGPRHPRRRAPALFEKFDRLDPNQTRGVGGTGLGLYICRELVRRMDGDIRLESTAERGRRSSSTCLWRRSPPRSAPRPRRPASTAPSDSSRSASPRSSCLVGDRERGQQPDHVAVEAAREQEETALESGGDHLLRQIRALLAGTEGEHRTQARAPPRSSSAHAWRSRRARRAVRPRARRSATRNAGPATGSSTTAAAAQATGLPPNVPPRPPGPGASISSARPVTAASGRPPPSDFPETSSVQQRVRVRPLLRSCRRIPSAPAATRADDEAAAAPAASFRSLRSHRTRACTATSQSCGVRNFRASSLHASGASMSAPDTARKIAFAVAKHAGDAIDRRRPAARRSRNASTSFVATNRAVDG